VCLIKSSSVSESNQHEEEQASSINCTGRQVLCVVWGTGRSSWLLFRQVLCVGDRGMRATRCPGRHGAPVSRDMSPGHGAPADTSFRETYPLETLSPILVSRDISSRNPIPYPRFERHILSKPYPLSSFREIEQRYGLGFRATLSKTWNLDSGATLSSTRVSGAV
jgi:hypothetical protein